MKLHPTTFAKMLIAASVIGFSAFPARSAPHINDTAQTACYDPTGAQTAPISCFVAPGLGEDGTYGRDVTAPNPNNGDAGFRFARVCNNGQEAGVGTCPTNPVFGQAAYEWACTRDKVSGLLWEVKRSGNSVDLRDLTYKFSYAVDFPGLGLTGTDALVAFANQLTGLCGTTNWRMPSYNELMTLAHYGISSPPRIDHNFFPNTPTAATWTTTTYTFDGTQQRTIGFGTGNDGFGPAFSAHRARLVSGVPLASVSRFTLIPNGTGLRDPLTRLVWSRCPLGTSWTGTQCIGTPTMTNWAGALNLAALAGNPWRLPSIAELSTLLRDTGANTGCIMLPDVFPSATPIWSNTPFVGGVGPSGGAWAFESGSGTCYTRQVQPVSSMGSVRLVRPY
jgi:Protein of unknown function (DUF1566)